jgi:transcriptional activator of cad operon
MERPTTAMLRIGDWCVDPKSGQISRDGETARPEERTMRLLLCLAGHAGEVVSIDELLSQVWPGVIVTPDSVYQAVASLRRLLGDNSRQPTYIATVPRLGYRMVATVGPWVDAPIQDRSMAPNGTARDVATATTAPTHGPRFGARFIGAAGAALCLVLFVAFFGAFWFRAGVANGSRPASPAAAQLPQKSIGSIGSVAVLPFLDLTEGMKNEEFADGITEELIDKLAKIPGLRVPAPTSSFYYKGKQIPVAEIAKTLGVAYVLDGSMRKSGTWIRVDVRLIRADNGFVVWSETYDQPMSDILTIQDDIAGKVTKALKASIEAGTGH